MRTIGTALRRTRAIGKNIDGNVMWLTALMMFPMLGMVGAGVDLSRYYTARSRLQQACDAGALATRRAMTIAGGLDATSKAEGDKMFKFNFPNGLYGSSATTFGMTTVDSAEIKGSAQTVMPPTVMKIFSFTDETLKVECNARLEIPNVDIVFVLDTTGSMAERNSGDISNRMVGMRQAVMDFFDTMAESQTPDTRIRYGFVPYSSNVNVGRLLYAQSSSLLATTADYQSRQYSGSNGHYDYRKITSPSFGSFLSSKTGTFNAPIGVNGANVTIPAWNGCIEELQTQSFTGSTVPSGAKDLDITYVPSGSDRQLQWKPHIPSMIFARGDAEPPSPSNPNPPQPPGNLSYDPIMNSDKMFYNYTHTGLVGNGYAACPSEAQLLTARTKSDRATIQAYVNGLVAIGGTYHDIGMIWGGRFIAPKGVFKTRNEELPAKGPKQSRHVIFMTDGVMSPNVSVYSAYGVEILDRRVGGGASNSNSNTSMTTLHNRRLQAACNAVKRDGEATLWVVSFGDDSTLSSSLTSCASSPDLAFQADNSAQLQAKFKEIAKSISQMRLTR